MRRRAVASILFLCLSFSLFGIAFSQLLTTPEKGALGAATTSAVPVPPDGYCYHGAFCGYDGASPTTDEMRTDVQRFTSTTNINKSLCIAEHAGTIYVGEDWFVLDPNDRSYMGTLIDEGLFKVLIISLNPCLRGSNDPTLDEQNIAAGKYDSWLATLVSRCNNFKDTQGNLYPLMVKIGVEVNQNNWEAYGADPTAFIAAFRYIVNYFRNHGVTNVAFVWNVTWQSSGYGYDMSDYYPGDDVVDWLTVDAYRWGTNDYFDNQITEFYNLYKNKGKPLGVAEWGVRLSVTDDTQGATYVNRVFDCLEGKNGQTAKPEFKYIRYHWSADSGGNRFTIQADQPTSTADYRPNTVAAYRTRVSDPRYLTSLAPPVLHSLTVTSTIDTIGGVPVTIDGSSHGNTPTTATPLAEGTHTISVPQSVQIGTDNYNFVKWDDNSTSPTRSYSLNNDATLTATFLLGPQQFTLTTAVSPSGAGTVTKNPNKPYYNTGEVVSLTASANTNYQWTAWQNADDNNVNPTTVTMSANCTVTAVFQRLTINIVVVAGAHGSVNPSGSQTLTLGQTYSYTAAPNAGYQIDHWSLGGQNEGSNSTLQLLADATMDGKTLTVTFSSISPPPPASVTLSVAVSGNGSVDLALGAHVFLVGDSLTITATPDAGCRFDHWDLSGANESSAPLLKLTVAAYMDGKTLTAIFATVPLTLTLQVSPAGAGTVEKNPNDSAFVYNEIVTIVATPLDSVHYQFSKWVDNDNGNEDYVGANGEPAASITSSVQMTSNRHLTAEFEQIVHPTLTLTANPPEGGSVPVVTETPPYDVDQIVHVTSHANPGYSLAGWFVDGSLYDGKSNTLSLTMDTNHTVTAVYALLPWHLDVYQMLDNSTSQLSSEDMPAGQSTTVTAAHHADYVLTGWLWDGHDLAVGAQPTVQISTQTPGSTHTLTAVYVHIPQPTLTVIVSPRGAGTVTVDPQPPFILGESVTASAQPSGGYAFVRWWLDGAQYGTNATVTVRINGNQTLIADFSLRPQPTSVSSGEPEFPFLSVVVSLILAFGMAVTLILAAVYLKTRRMHSI